MKTIFKELNLALTETQLNQFETYYNYLIEENKKYNLTAIEDQKQVYIKHFFDSLTLLETGLFNGSVKVCDIGSGAGFPGVPLKIIKQDIKLTLVESQTKKTTFLKNLLNQLNIVDVKVKNARAEIFAKNNLTSFDLVTARAVAPLNILVELALPLVKKGGYFVAMKGLNYEAELDEAKNGIMLLGGKLKEVIEFDLPSQMGKRNLLVINKVKVVKNYPRSYSQIKKKPL